MKRMFAFTMALAASLPLRLAAEPPAPPPTNRGVSGANESQRSIYKCPPEFIQLLERKQFEEAWSYALREQDRNPHVPDGWMLRCDVRLAEDKHDDALREAETAVERFPKSAAAIQLRGACHFERAESKEGEFREAELEAAIADLTAAIELGGDRDVLLGNRGVAFALLARDNEALADLREVRKEKRTAFGTSMAVLSLVRLKELDAAEQAASEAVAAFPREMSVLNAAMFAAFANENIPRVLEVTRRMVELDPHSSSVRANYAEALVGSRNLDAAVEEQTEVIRLATTAKEKGARLARRSEINAARGRVDEMIADLTAAIEADPSTCAHLVNRGKRYVELQRLALAEADVTTVIERIRAGTGDATLLPLADAYSLRSMLKVSQKRPREALADATAAIQADPKNAHRLVERAECHRVLGDLPLAHQDLTAAIEGVRKQTLISKAGSLPNFYRRRATISLFLGDQAAYKADRAEADRLEKEETSEEAGKP